MNSVQTQTLSIKGNGGGEAYIDFYDGQLCVSVVIEGKQADFNFEPVTLRMFAHAYKLHCEECEECENLKSATPFPKCYLQEKWTFDS